MRREAESTRHDAEASEYLLVARMRAGDAVACEEFVRKHIGRALIQARRILDHEADAADAVQESFLAFFKGLPTYRGQARPGTWLHRIVTNTALMRLRARRRKRERSIEDLLPCFYPDGHRIDPRPAWHVRPEDALQNAELRRIVAEKICQLPENYRNVLILRDIQDRSTEEAARELGESEGAIKTRLHRARQALRKLLEGELT